MSTVFLVHGGLWEPMDAERFWRTPGIVATLEARGVTVLVPDRPQQPGSWAEEVAVLREHLPQEPVVVVGASNGCSVAALLAIEYPELVEGLVLAWPATGGDPVTDERTHAGLTSRGASSTVADELLAADTLRGVRDEDLARLGIPVAVLPSVPENPSHQRKTVDALLGLIPGSRELPGCPEPPTPYFPPHKDELAGTLAAFARRQS
ncbi:alpha/beta fold hydrolase [Kribbella ginsengisoli]|uniref:AB hydrolase-1 domain-containing protein n=1 Tax=Kribbella ginsengisoli TaxID=363865 RepID=A0ABP6WJI1_9ACTN